MSEATNFGTVTPPADMMQAARLSLTPTGFTNLMERTGGKAPTPAELVEFADAERLAQEATTAINGAVDSTVGQVAALLSGEAQGGGVSIAARVVGDAAHELAVPRIPNG